MALEPAAITGRAVSVDAARGRAFDAAGAARRLLHESRNAALATLDPGGWPYGTATSTMPAPDGRPVFFAARLALHCRNILADSRISLSYAAYDRADILSSPRMTLAGHALPVPQDEFAGLTARFIARFPKARLYLSLPDAMLFRMEVRQMQIGGGPGRNAGQADFDPLRISLDDAGALMAAEAELLAEMNGDQALIAALARLAGVAARRRCRAVSLDPQGLVLAAKERLCRLDFAEPVHTAAAFRASVAELMAGAPRP